MAAGHSRSRDVQFPTADGRPNDAITPASEWECVCTDSTNDIRDLESTEWTTEWLASFGAGQRADGIDIQYVSTGLHAVDGLRETTN